MHSVTCLAADTCLTADPGITSSIPARSHTFMETDHEIISTFILLPSSDSRRVVVSYKRKYVHKVLVICLVMLAQEKNVVRLSDHPDMTMYSCWLLLKESNQTKKQCHNLLYWFIDKTRILNYVPLPTPRGGGYINFGADPFGFSIGVSVLLCYVQDISWTRGD